MTEEDCKSNDLIAGVVEAAGDEVCGEDDALRVVSAVGGQHDGGQHREVGGGQQQARDQQLRGNT